MNIFDFVYDNIYKGALRAGASERMAKDHAVMGLDDWKKGKFKKASALIEERIKEAKKQSR